MRNLSRLKSKKKKKSRRKIVGIPRSKKITNLHLLTKWPALWGFLPLRPQKTRIILQLPVKPFSRTVRFVANIVNTWIVEGCSTAPLTKCDPQHYHVYKCIFNQVNSVVCGRIRHFWSVTPSFEEVEPSHRRGATHFLTISSDTPCRHLSSCTLCSPWWQGGTPHLDRP